MPGDVSLHPVRPAQGFGMTGLFDKPSEILCWIIDGQKIPMKKTVNLNPFCILNSSFCILHSVFYPSLIIPFTCSSPNNISCRAAHTGRFRPARQGFCL
jgi:hypothetical protein